MMSSYYSEILKKFNERIILELGSKESIDDDFEWFKCNPQLIKIKKLFESNIEKNTVKDWILRLETYILPWLQNDKHINFEFELIICDLYRLQRICRKWLVNIYDIHTLTIFDPGYFDSSDIEENCKTHIWNLGYKKIIRLLTSSLKNKNDYPSSTFLCNLQYLISCKMYPSYIRKSKFTEYSFWYIYMK